MNIVEQYFPGQINKEDIIVDNMCLVMKFYEMSKAELDELTIPEYLILRDYAIKKLKEEKKMLDQRGKK